MDQEQIDKLDHVVGALIQRFSMIELLVLAWGYTLTKDRIVFEHFLKNRKIAAQLDLLKQMIENSELDPVIMEWFADAFPKIEVLRLIRNTVSHNPQASLLIDEDPIIKNLLKNDSDELDLEAVKEALSGAVQIVESLHANYEKAFGTIPTIETRSGIGGAS